jgi:hypothetical protein
MTTLERAAIAAARMWARLYTWRMPRTLREARIAEIESDLWESSRDQLLSAVWLSVAAGGDSPQPPPAPSLWWQPKNPPPPPPPPPPPF